jgi:hypothetical protein
MTIYGTPGSTIINQAGGFQGTTPGNITAGATIQPVNPGVGLFPPNSDNRSGDTITASVSRAACPANVDITNAGTRDSRPGRTVHESMSDANATGTSTSLTTVFGGSLNQGPAGGAGPGAGGFNQTNAPSSGVGHILPANADVKVPAIATPAQYQG